MVHVGVAAKAGEKVTVTTPADAHATVNPVPAPTVQVASAVCVMSPAMIAVETVDEGL
jgi:hypothetical protein